MLWDSVPSVSRAQLDSSLGRFSVDKASSIIVRAQTQYNTFTGECALADKWYRTAAEQVAAQGIDKSQYTIRCVHVCGCGCVEAMVVEGGGCVCVFKLDPVGNGAVMVVPACPSHHCCSPPPLLLRLSFTTRVYLFPQEAGGGTCTASGYSNLGCTRTDCNSWLRAFGSGLVLHELGHLTGFSHAQFDQDNNGLLSATEEMGDLSDPMTADG